jgi:hypothetical protein
MEWKGFIRRLVYYRITSPPNKNEEKKHYKTALQLLHLIAALSFIIFLPLATFVVPLPT